LVLVHVVAMFVV